MYEIEEKLTIWNEHGSVFFARLVSRSNSITNAAYIEGLHLYTVPMDTSFFLLNF